MNRRFLHEVFEVQVDARPHQAAVVFRGRPTSYGDLDRHANRLAHRLRNAGAGPGARVGLLLQRGDLPITAILAVLKSGAAYVPIDPAQPPERIRHILEDAEVRLLLTESALAARAAPPAKSTAIVLDDPVERAVIARSAPERPTAAETGLSPRDLCYIIYTSGTSGRPKGIMTEHRNVVAYVDAFRDFCGLVASDRVYQGLSLSFDGSVEEVWMAFSSGATLVIGPPEIAQMGDETARFLTEQSVTFFSTVPTFLSMIQDDVPSLRLVVVGGEQCPPELVRRWVQPGRRMLNAYGPTETTVTATAWECRADSSVKIGRPLPGYETHVLDEMMRPVRTGEAGELYIGGAGVARGYLNQPELTRNHFVRNPFDDGAGAGRLYRTGDLVREDGEGELEFLGRIDTQVKVRGYRIELAEIEAVLRDLPGIAAAAVKVVSRGNLSELAAYVVPRDGDAMTIDRPSVLSSLRRSLPSYMVPGFLETVDTLPTQVSGKMDRRRLPDPTRPLVAETVTHVAPRTELEATLARAWEKLLGVSPVSIDADFFRDLGGYSLLAARLVSRLRSEHGIEVALRDVYDNPTIASLARSIARSSRGVGVAADEDSGATDVDAGREVSATRRRLCISLQAVASVLLYGPAAVTAAATGLVWHALKAGELAVGAAAALFAAILLLWYPLGLIVGVGVKWLIVGRFEAGRHPLWGAAFFRLWLVDRIHHVSGAVFLAGTPLMGLYYRLMGAKIGHGAIIDTPFCTAFDLVTVGEDSCIGAETQLLGYRIEDGHVELGTVKIGRRCFVGIHSCLGLDVQMQDDARLGDLSLLPDGAIVPAGEAWRGSPACAGTFPLPEPADKETRRRPALYGLVHFLLVEALWVLLFATLIPGISILRAAFAQGGLGWGLAAILATVPVSVVTFCLLVAGLKAVLLHRTRPGTYDVESGLFLRKWFVDLLITVSRSYMHAVYATIYLPPWLRLMGARIGKLAEISTVSQVTPDLIDIAAGSFFADGSMVGGRRFFRGRVQYLSNRVGRRSFVGNSAILPLGRNLGDECLLGVLSTPPDDRETTPDGSEWLGSPSFLLPHRVKVEGFAESVTYAPTRSLLAQRLVIDAVRILIPGVLAWYGGAAFFAYLAWGVVQWGTMVTCLVAPPVLSLIAAATALAVVVLKHAVMGRFRPVVKPLWSRYVWWNEVINGAYESAAVPALAPWLGTPVFNAYLRLLGCRIGRRAYIGTTLFSEFDLVEIGDRAVLNVGVVVQNHLFEDRIMKSSHLRIGDGCTVGNMSVVLYDTEIQKGASIGPLSLLMKGETVPPGTRWIGIPTCRQETTGRNHARAS